MSSSDNTTSATPSVFTTVLSACLRREEPTEEPKEEVEDGETRRDAGFVTQPMMHHGHGRPAVVWMAAPGSIPGCPPGLEYLTLVDTVIVEQLIELLEVFTGIETANRYVIRNAMGQQIYYAMEMSSLYQRDYNGAWRAFTMRITDNAMREIIRIHRPEEPCCDYAECFVEAPPGHPIGYVRGTSDGFCVTDPMRQPFLFVVRPPYVNKNSQAGFPITSAHGQSIGMIAKHYGGYVKEAMTNADTFSAHFPLDLTAQMKAILIAVVFMIDFRWFEDKHQTYHTSHHHGYYDGHRDF